MIPSSKINAWAARLQTAHAGSSFASSRGGLAALRWGPSVSLPRVPRGADPGGGAQRGGPETQGRPRSRSRPRPNPPCHHATPPRSSARFQRPPTPQGRGGVGGGGSSRVPVAPRPAHALLRQLSQAAVRTPSLRSGFRHPRLSVPTSRMLKGPSPAWGRLSSPHLRVSPAEVQHRGSPTQGHLEGSRGAHPPGGRPTCRSSSGCRTGSGGC